MKTIQFKAYKRSAALVDKKYIGAIRAVFSFNSPAARYSAEHRSWLQQKAEGIPEEERTGWDGKSYMMDKAGVLPVGLLLGAEKELAKAGFKAEIKKWEPRPHVLPKKGFIEKNKAYEYQNEANTAMLSCISNGGGLVLSATGTGKTKIAAQFFSWIPGKVLFLVDQVDLLYQTQKELQMWLSKEGFDQKVGVVGNSKFEPERVTVAIIQTLQKHKKLNAFKKWAKDIDVVLIDEIHVQMARRNFAVVQSIKPQAVIGLTATMQLGKKPIRFKCNAICGPKIFEFPIEQGTKQGVLTQGVVVQAFSDRNREPHKELMRTRKDKRTGKISKQEDIANDYEHEVVYNKTLAKDVKALVSEGIKRDYRVVLLLERVKHLKRMAKRLAKFKPRLCYGAITVDERKLTLKDFDKGTHNLIIANKVFTKGINLKRVDLIIDIAQRKNKNDCMQKYGRGVRLHTDKGGLLYIGVYTSDKNGDKAALSQRGAFKKAKIPLKVITDKFKASTVLDTAESLLKQTLRQKKAA